MTAPTWPANVTPPAPKRACINIRIDAEVLEFFRDTGRGYQRRMNDVLRAYMQHVKEGDGPPA